MLARAFITGLGGLTISANERAFVREAQPWGLIIFKRNVNTPQQVTELVRSFREAVGWAAPVLVDQEGGRVQRLGPPHWQQPQHAVLEFRGRGVYPRPSQRQIFCSR